MNSASPVDLLSILRPSSLALVGATDSSGWSRTAFDQWTGYAPDLAVHCVNPRRSSVHGRRAYPSLADIGEPVDMVYVMTPRDQVAPTILEAGRLGIRGAVVLTGGFGGRTQTGAKTALLHAAREGGVMVVGPNCNGFVNVTDRRVVYGGPLLPPLTPGRLSIISQSGAVATRLVAMAQIRAIGLSKVVTVGDQATLSLATVIRSLVDDDHTGAMAVFLEGIDDTAAFAEALTAARAADKPVVVLKAGRSEAAANAALDHTGAIAGDDAVGRAALRQLGAVQAASMEELVVTAGYLAHAAGPHPRRAFVVAASGGAGELLADQAEEVGLELPTFQTASAAALRELLPDDAAVGNPLDVTGKVVGDPELLTRSVDLVRSGVDDATVIVYTTMPRHPLPDQSAQEQFFGAVADLATSPGPRVCVVAQGAADLSAFPSVPIAGPVPVFESIRDGVIALAHAADWSERTADTTEPAMPAPATGTPGVGAWGEWRSRAFLEKAGVAFPEGILTTDREEAVRAAEKLGRPVVLKIVSDEILHKTDIGGVALDLEGADEIRRAFDRLLAATETAFPEVTPDGILVSPMIGPGLELLVSVTTDEQWGKVLTVALGGVWVEVFADATRRILPVTPATVREMLEELRAAPLLHGVRGQAGVDLDELVVAVCAIANSALPWGEALRSVEINPLRATVDGVVALDALVRWKDIS